MGLTYVSPKGRKKEKRDKTKQPFSFFIYYRCLCLFNYRRGGGKGGKEKRNMKGRNGREKKKK
jgi:hypothetical protein